MENLSADSVSSLATPKLAEYCNRLYSRFYEESTFSEKIGHHVWRGPLTRTCTEVGIPDGVYKRVTDRLHELKCIEQRERGVRGQPTTIILLRPPTVEVWAEAEKFDAEHLTRPLHPAILSRKLGEIEKSLGGLNVVEAMVDLQKQIRKLERRLEKFEQ